MTFFDSKDSTFSLEDTVPTERDLTAFIDDITGLPGPVTLDPVTALGDTGAKSIPGLENVTITISGPWDDAATTGLDAVLGPLRGFATVSVFKYGPKGTTSTFPRYTGSCRLADYQIHPGVGNRLEYTATLQVEGSVTRDTF